MLDSELPLSGGIGSAVRGGFETIGVEVSGPGFELQAEQRMMASNIVQQSKPRIRHLLVCTLDKDGSLVSWRGSDELRRRIVIITPRHSLYGRLPK
jgi:hypothetical protein